MPPRIYLDHAATTPMRPEARQAVADGLVRWANPSSPHAEGRAARAALEDARDRIRAALGWPHELIFTSGASESAAIALGRQALARPALGSAVEHKAVLHARPDAMSLPVDADGVLDPVAMIDLLRAHPEPIVAVQHANNETGVVQPIDSIGRAVGLVGGVLFVDCAQTAGKLPLPEADLIAVSAHKLGGPPGIGALLVRDLALLSPDGAGQERGYRAGTENLPAILGLAAALDAAKVGDPIASWAEPLLAWREQLDDVVDALGGEIVGGHFAQGAAKLPTIAAYRLPGLTAASLLIRLDMMGFAVSAGSACSSGSIHASHVLAAMGYGEAGAGEVIRVSFGWTTTGEEVAGFATALTRIVEEARDRAR